MDLFRTWELPRVTSTVLDPVYPACFNHARLFLWGLTPADLQF